MKTYFTFIQEAAKVHVTTGHLDHVTHFYHNPSATFTHFKNVLSHFGGGGKKIGTISQKADGGMSVKAVKMPNGTVGVGYKTGEIFTKPEQIAATGKEHYVRSLTPILHHVSQMSGFKPGTGFQFDLLHQSDDHTKKTTISQPNTLKYRIPKGVKLALAAHSQYKINKKGVMKKISSQPDVSQLQAPGVYAPQLSMHGLKLKLTPERKKKIKEHISSARALLTPELIKFSRTLATGQGHHPKFHEFHEQYHSHSSRTSGVRSVDEMRGYVDTFVNKKAQQPAKRKTESEEQYAARANAHREKLRTELHRHISNHEPRFHALFNAHNHLISAKHHLLDQMREHETGFDLQTHAGEEHEGLVSSIGNPGTDEHMAKFVREGPTGFPKKNHENPRFAAR
jgi:hypothetical protein